MLTSSWSFPFIVHHRPPPAHLCVVATQGHCVVATQGHCVVATQGHCVIATQGHWQPATSVSVQHRNTMFLNKNGPKIKNVTKWVAVAPFGVKFRLEFIPRASWSHWDTSQAQKRQFFCAPPRPHQAPWAPCWGQPLRAGYTGTLVLLTCLFLEAPPPPKEEDNPPPFGF